MSRLIVKNLPKNVSNKKFNDIIVIIMRIKNFNT